MCSPSSPWPWPVRASPRRQPSGKHISASKRGREETSKNFTSILTFILRNPHSAIIQRKNKQKLISILIFTLRTPHSAFRIGKAEGVGFEPTRAFWTLLVFKTSAFNRSAIPPHRKIKHLTWGGLSVQVRLPTSSRNALLGCCNQHCATWRPPKLRRTGGQTPAWLDDHHKTLPLPFDARPYTPPGSVALFRLASYTAIE